MSADFIFRMIGMVVFAVLGAIWGAQLSTLTGAESSILTPEQYSFLVGLVGALIGLILTPYITSRPIKAIKKKLAQLPGQNLSAALIGLVVGLIVAALLSFPLSLLPSPFGKIMPFIGVLLFGYLGVSLFVSRQQDIFGLFSSISHGATHGTDTKEGWAQSRTLLMDTSVIIDGRILDIARSGFIPGTFIIPRFVLSELQYIADSQDNLRRQRGRRGLDILSQLQKDTDIPLKITDVDVEGAKDADEKLVILARQMRCPILTNDYNLNRVAELQGVTVLNINELANAVKSVMMPGETLAIKVIQEGKDKTQGVGFLEDGTMVVVENGKNLIGQEHLIIVTKVLQTAAGRMIFGKAADQKD